MDLSMSPQEEEELLEMFSFEAQEMHEQLNELFTSYETDADDEILDEIFRITHTLKGSAMGMGFVGIADISHVVEDVFTAIKAKKLKTSKSLFTDLYKANDKLGELIAHIRSEEKISHKGIKTKLQVVLRKAMLSEDEKAPKANQGEHRETMPDTQTAKAETTDSTGLEINSPDNLAAPAQMASKESGEEVIISIEGRSGQNENAISKIKNWMSQLKVWWNGSQSNDVQETDLTRSANKEPGAQEPVVAEQTSNAKTIDQERIETNTQQPRPSATTNDEKSVLDLLEPSGSQSVEENDELVKDLQDKVTISDSVQVPIRKLDNLMNQVGQLIIERDRLMAINAEHGRRNTEYAGLQRITSDLQYSVMDVRLVQIGTLFSKFHRIARDVAAVENKLVRLEVKGTEVEIDRNILKTMSDSMVHLIRNAVSHGIESPEERDRLGKSREANITLSARSEKDHVYIEVKDDGQGIDPEAIRKKVIEKGLATAEYLGQLSDDEVILFIFEPGFSNAEVVNEISGRGVGMDVVKNSTESIGGQIFVDTKVGEGTTISLRLPASMAVKGVLLFQMKDQEFAFALSYTEAVVSLQKKNIHKAGIGLMSSYLKQTISVVFFSDLLEMKDFSEVYEPGSLHRTFDACKPDEKFDVIVVSYANKFIGIIVDKLLQQKEIIEKAIPKPLDNNKLLSGTTILGNGNVCLVADVSAIADILYQSKLKVHEAKKVS